MDLKRLKEYTFEPRSSKQVIHFDNFEQFQHVLQLLGRPPFCVNIRKELNSGKYAIHLYSNSEEYDRLEWYLSNGYTSVHYSHFISSYELW